MYLSPIDALLQLVSPTPSELDSLTTDWEALYDVAARHSLAPLLHARLEPILDRLPPPVRESLHRARTESAAQIMFFEFELMQIVQTFRTKKVPLIVFKGIPLARQLLHDPALRPMIDIDVLVRGVDLVASTHILNEMGWEMPDTANPFQTKAYDLNKEVAGAPIRLELHWSNQRKGEYDLPEERLWQETIETDEGTLFTPEMALFTLVLHAARHSFRPYRQLVDIAHAVALWNDTLDWERVVALATEANALPMLATILALVRRDLNTPMPKHESLARYLDRRRIQLTIRFLSPQRLLYGQKIGILDRYWVPVASGAWQPAKFFLADMLRTPKQIAHIYDLPPDSPLLPLYVIFRPFLLARKYLQRVLSR